jgi:CDP-6-deoxy-D-xylo-4-hexulose-3-dehydrase
MNSSYTLAKSSWNNKEVQAAIGIIKSGRLTMGPVVKEFEQQFASKMGSKYAVMVNSGSSANLIATAALMYKSTNPLKDGDEALVPAVSWGTTYFPYHQNRIKQKVVDISIRNLGIDHNAVSEHLSDNTKVLSVVNLLGCPADIHKLKDIAAKRSMYIIEDNCESMGADVDGKMCGTFGDIGTYSMFFSHHICTIEGGVAVTDDIELYEIMICLRAHGWLRNLPDINTVENKIGDDFKDSFRFVLPGYNVRPTEIQAAIGIEQLKKHDALLSHRIKNSSRFKDIINKINYTRKSRGQDDIILQTTTQKHSYFGFSMIMESHDERDNLVKVFKDNMIECRPIVAGDITKNPVMDRMDISVSGPLPMAKKADACGLFIGNHGYNMKKEMDHLKSVLSANC